jgi:hypothetical protein
MVVDEKANLARKLTHALHQAPENPELFVNVVKNLVKSNGLHITDLSVSVGDLTIRLAEQLREARRDAKPTFDTLIDIAGTKLSLGKRPERTLSEVLGVSASTIEDHKKLGRVPRVWLDKIKSLPDLDETRAEFDPPTQRVIELLAESGYRPGAIHESFMRIRTSRAGLHQIEKVVHGSAGELRSEELMRMKRDLFSSAKDAERRFEVWLATQLRSETKTDVKAVYALNPKQVERIRARFKREIDLRVSDPAYKRIATAAELIDRPVRGGARSVDADPFASSRRLRTRLDELFGDEVPDRRNRRLAQLTGLDERHTLDLLNGANAVNEMWWTFLNQVEASAKRDKIESAKSLQQSFMEML